MTRAAFTGTFDPFTNGHFDVVCRAAKIFDEVLVGVLNNANKSSLFSIDERVDIISHYCLPKNVKAIGYEGTSFDFVVLNEANLIIRGVRGTVDVDLEIQYAIMNKKYANIETMFLFSDLEKSFISSTLIKTLLKSGLDVRDFVNDYTYEKMKEKNEREIYKDICKIIN